MKRYFVTGIGTDVGKTLVSAVLTEALEADYWKPVQTGPPESSDRMTIQHLLSNRRSVCFNEAYHFKTPASPHLAAALEQAEIHVQDMRCPASSNKYMIVEGAGGVLVPLNNRFFVIDLAKRFECEVILVCRNYLGCINHSLLSIDYLLRHHFKIRGLVLNGSFDPLVKAAILNYADFPLLAELPEVTAVNKESVRQLSTTVSQNLF